MNATIIAASLNDKELKSSIDTLVSYVDGKIKSMATNFDNEIKRMKDSLKNLGNIKIDSGSASDGGASRRTKRNTEEAKSVKETTIAYDQLAIATQKAMQPKSAEQSFYAFIQNYREHAAKLASEIKSLPSISLDRQIAEYDRLQREIGNVQRKIQELRTQLNEVGRNPNASRFEIKAITDQIAAYETRIRQLTIEQIANTRRIANEENAVLAQKQALYEKTVQLVRELTSEQQQQTKVTQDTATTVQRENQAKQETVAITQKDNQAKQETVTITQAQVQAEQQVAQAVMGTARITETVLEMQKRSRQQLINESTGGGKMGSTFQTYENFAQALAHVLGLQQQEIQLANSETASYNQLQQTLKTLQAAYNQLNKSERDSDNGKTLVASMHEVQRAMQKIQQQSGRPTNLKAILGIEPKTLDDIVYKMQMLTRYRSGINLTSPTAQNDIKTLNYEIERLRREYNKLIGQNTQTAHSNELLGRSFDYIKNRLAFVVTVGTFTRFTKSLVDIRGQYELLERSIGILFDSMQRGSQIFAELNAMAIKSPFTTMELGAAAKQLSAYDIAAKDVVDTTKRLADMAAAVGVPIERLTYALGQIKAYGYLNARDARMFANAGIPLVQNLADMYTKLEGRLVSVGDIYDRIKKKAISFEDVLKVVNEMTDEGGRFFNFQEKAADTLKVKLANLTLAMNNMFNEMGKSNQGLLTTFLSIPKTLFENWRKLNNIIWALITAYGALKIAQIGYILFTTRANLATATAYATSRKFVGVLRTMGSAMTSLAKNPFTWVMVAATALTYLLFQYSDLVEANRQFNKSVSDGAQENIDSINKFFDEYKKDIDTINSLNTADQQKMWERIKEEIEKTSKNAQQFIDILENIPDISQRVTSARGYLETIQTIQAEAKRLADHGLLDMGGGFADDSLGKDLADFEEKMNSVLKKYESLKEAQEDYDNSLFAWSKGNYAFKYYKQAVEEVEDELLKFVSTFDKADIGKILGSGTNQEQLANLREFTSLIRDNFLATEDGQKITTEGRALLNTYLDRWISKQSLANKLQDEESAKIEKNRTAWETFFSTLNKSEKESLDYLIATNQTGSKEFTKIWDAATERMQKNSIVSYQTIQQQIANLRNTPDIVINVVYRENKEVLDAQQQQFKDTFLTPTGYGALSAEKYFEQVKELTTKYGRFQKKEGEDNVEWEKRLGEIYRDNESKLASLNKQLANSANLSDIDRKAKDKDKKALEDEQKVLDEVRAKQNFNYEKDKKGGRKDTDVVAEALKQEIQLVKEMRSNYDKLRKAGVSNMDAIDLASKGYEATIIRINNVLQKFGIDKFNASNFAGKDVRGLLSALEQQRDALLASGKVKTSSLESLEITIKDLRVDAKTYDMKKITDGLNNELSKLKDEYELAVELDANPEMGDMFAEMFNINTSELPHSIDEYMNRVYAEFNKLRGLYGGVWSFDIFKADEKTWKEWGDIIGVTGEELEKLKKPYVEAQNVVKKWAQDTIKQTQDLQYKLADNEGKIAIKLKERNELNEKFNKETNEQQKELYRLQLQELDNYIAELRAGLLSEIPEYARVFNSVAEHSESVTRRLISDLRKIYDFAKAHPNADGTYTITGSNGKQTILDRKEFDKRYKELDKEARKVQAPFKKISEAFKPTEENGVVDYAKGIELISKEIENLGNIAQEIGNFASILGFSEDTVETINDVAESLKGVATVGNGLAQIASGDYLAGAASVLSGVVSVIGTWADNSDKKIERAIKDSELAIKRLELSYVDLQRAVDKAYGSSIAGAKRLAASAKELELQELQRQLRLENARSSKSRDENRIIELQKQIKELRYEIQDMTREIVDDLLGTDVGSFAENLVSSMIDAFKQGEDYMKVFADSFDEMVDNMIMKSIVSRVVASYLDSIWDSLENRINERTKTQADNLAKERAKYDEIDSLTDEEIGARIYRNVFVSEGERKRDYDNWKRLVDEYRNNAKKAMDAAQKEYDAVSQIGDSDIDSLLGTLAQTTPELAERIKEMLNKYYKFGESGEAQLSNLQQGIQGVTEDTASAIEGYMNIVSQRVFENGGILAEIRDTVVSFDMDVQLGTLAQMLLQLQQSYQVQQNIEMILNGVLNPSGRAIVVELNS